MPLTRITSKGIADSAVTEDKITNSSVSADKLSANSVNSGKIVDGAVAAGDLASTLDLSPKTVTLSASTVQALKQSGKSFNVITFLHIQSHLYQD